MERISTVKKRLEKAGYTVIERDDTIVLSQELQTDTQTFDDGEGYTFNYPPFVHDCSYDTSIHEDVEKLTGKDWYWECEYPTTFKLYEA